MPSMKHPAPSPPIWPGYFGRQRCYYSECDCFINAFQCMLLTGNALVMKWYCLLSYLLISYTKTSKQMK